MAVDLERLELALPGIWTPPAGEAVQSLVERYAGYTRDDIFGPDMTDFYVAHYVGAIRKGMTPSDTHHRALIAQDRIRWLAVQLALANARIAELEAAGKHLLENRQVHEETRMDAVNGPRYTVYGSVCTPLWNALYQAPRR